MSRVRGVYDETTRFIDDKELKKAIKDPNVTIIMKNGKNYLESVDTNDGKKSVCLDDANLEDIYFYLKEFVKENGLDLLDECTIDDFISFIHE